MKWYLIVMLMLHALAKGEFTYWTRRAFPSCSPCLPIVEKIPGCDAQECTERRYIVYECGNNGKVHPFEVCERTCTTRVITKRCIGAACERALEPSDEYEDVYACD
ncbi:hypothetical protein J120_03585 [candidate division TM6 bacterium JCVI TM6SC1]|uniref:Uncharacterized protein n=1 Tax=candidate division TM6 bacterium JCVI TM6SC1 TaxID=1306947 RepID=A0A0D2JKU2_9BACT|nr:hypothetical protein J120_03585 [candidate division TM6 bacterium JCVI TM6SC1]